MGESESNKRKHNTVPEKSGIISFLISAVNDAFFGITGLQFGLLNIVVFVLAAIVLLAIWIWLTISFCKKGRADKESYEYQKKQYLNRCDKNASVGKVYQEIAKNEEKFLRKRKGEKRCYIIIAIILIIGIIADSGMAVSQYSVMKVEKETGEGTVNMNVSSNENTTTVKTTVVNEGNTDQGLTPEEKAEMESKTFVLSDPERLVVLSDADVERAFYVSLDEDKLEKEVKDHLDDICNQKKRSTILKDSAEERLAAKAQSKEDIFLNKIEEAKEYKTQENYEGWKSVIPKSNTLKEIMDDREFLLGPLEEDEEIDGVLCIRLANNNQLLADEYKLQGGRPETVVYYYVEAIKRIEDGLAYEDLPQGYRSGYTGYLKARYKDVADYIENNLERFGTEKEKYQQIMDKANAIYKAM